MIHADRDFPLHLLGEDERVLVVDRLEQGERRRKVRDGYDNGVGRVLADRDRPSTLQRPVFGDLAALNQSDAKKLQAGLRLPA